MNDLLQLKKQPAIEINHDKIEEQNSSVSQINITEHKHQQQPQSETIVKCKEKSNVNHKRPSLTHDIISSKRAKGQDTMKATPQLMQQLLASTGCNQKVRLKSQSEASTSNANGWSSQPKSQQSSNSVLMNLLVSGCDVSAGYYTCLPRSKVAKA